MIQEVILTCALSLPAGSFQYGNHPLATEEVSFARMLKVHGPVLIVGQDLTRVTLFRKLGVRAFGALTQDAPADIPWQVIADAAHLSIQTKSMHAVYWDHPNPTQSNGFKWLKEATRVIWPGGFLFVNEDYYHAWPIWLKQWGWDRLPFHLNGYSVYQKPTGEDYHRLLKQSA